MKRILFKPSVVLEAGVSLCSPLFRNVVSLYVDRSKCSFKMATAHHQKFIGLFPFLFSNLIYYMFKYFKKFLAGFQILSEKNGDSITEEGCRSERGRKRVRGAGACVEERRLPGPHRRCPEPKCEQRPVK